VPCSSLLRSELFALPVPNSTHLLTPENLLLSGVSDTTLPVAAVEAFRLKLAVVLAHIAVPPAPENELAGVDAGQSGKEGGESFG